MERFGCHEWLVICAFMSLSMVEFVLFCLAECALDCTDVCVLTDVNCFSKCSCTYNQGWMSTNLLGFSILNVFKEHT